MNSSKHYSRPGMKYEKPKIVIDNAYLRIKFIEQMEIFFKLTAHQVGELTKALRENLYLLRIGFRNQSGDDIRSLAMKNWVRHNII